MNTTQRSDARSRGSGVGSLALWTLAWIATLALASFGPPLLWNSAPVISWLAIGLNVAVGIVWVVVHARYLRGVDDLQRKIMMDAIGVALGLGLVGGFAYAAASNIDLINFRSDIAFLSILMGLVYVVAVAVGSLRYR